MEVIYSCTHKIFVGNPTLYSCTCTINWFELLAFYYSSKFMYVILFCSSALVPTTPTVKYKIFEIF